MGTVFFVGASELATLTNVFTVTSGGVTTPTDPTTVTLVVTDPQGTATTYTYAGAQITHTGAGAFAKDISCTLAGEWSYVWTGTGAVSDVNHGSFTVQETNLGHLYVTPQMLKSRAGISATDSSNDQELYGACYAASRQIENYCERIFWRTLSTEARLFTWGIEWNDPWLLDLGPFNDLVSVTSIMTDLDGDGVFEATWSASDYELQPVSTFKSEARPYTQVHSVGNQRFPIFYGLGRTGRVQITGVFGWPAVPAPVTEAARILGAELFKAKDAPFGIASFGEYGGIRIRENPMVATLLEGYRHFNRYMI
jgi:hypothetical protein